MIVAWSYVKKYWLALVAIVGAVVAFILLRDRSGDLSKTLDDLQKTHQDELDKITAANKQRVQKSLEDEEQLRLRLDEVQKQAAAQQVKLDAAKQKQIADIISKSSGDPTELAEQLSAATGFRVILP